MAPDWRQLLRWLKSGRPAADAVDATAPGVRDLDSRAMIPEEKTSADERPLAPSAPASENPSTHISSGASRPASRQVSPDTVADPPLNRNGIPVLNPADDIERLLRDTEETGPQEDPTAADVQRSVAHSLNRKKRDIGPPQKARREKQRTNRHGLPLLSDQEDLQAHFRTTATSDPLFEDRQPVRRERPDDCYRRDKNGIPMLDHCHDLGRLIEAASDERDSDEDLIDAFERSIAHDAHTLIKKKTGGYFPMRQLTLKERLKRYPKPQRQLDLHGLTAIQAEQRTDACIYTAHADGLFTLRIIVGKGLHSESGAVLPDVVEDRLNRLKRDGLVMAYRWEKGVKRKSGAVIVYLEVPF